MLSQQLIILKALRRGKTLTPMVAFGSMGITKLATRISEILSRKMLDKGEKIVKAEVRKNGKRFMSYRMEVK